MKIARRRLARLLAAGALARPASSAAPQAAGERDPGATPRAFSPRDYRLLSELCQRIVPADEDSGGAVEAGAPQFIDLLASENPDYRRRLAGGLLWLDAQCRDRYGQAFLDCSERQRREMLDSIAYRRQAEKDRSLAPGVEFFAFLRELTLDGFFTSRIGIDYLGYRGNGFLERFPGCPE